MTAIVTVLRLEHGSYLEEATVEGDEPYEATYPVAVTLVPNRLLRR